MTSPLTSSGSQVETPASFAAELAARQRRPGTSLAVTPSEPHRQARTRSGVLQRLAQLVELDQGGSRLEPVGAVVASEDDRTRTGLGALYLAAQQFLGFVLVLGGLQRVGVLTRQHAVILRLRLTLEQPLQRQPETNHRRRGQQCQRRRHDQPEAGHREGVSRAVMRVGGRDRLDRPGGS